MRIVSNDEPERPRGADDLLHALPHVFLSRQFSQALRKQSKSVQERPRGQDLSRASIFLR